MLSASRSANPRSARGLPPRSSRTSRLVPHRTGWHAGWQPPMIRRTSKRVGVRTESSARFERGIDTGAVLAASLRAQQLMREVAGGRVVSKTLDVYPSPLPGHQVSLRWPRVERLLGISVAKSEGIMIWRRLGWEVAAGHEHLVVTVPSFRGDVEREKDLIEDISRHYGYERIPEHMPVEATAMASRAPVLEAERMVRGILIRAGLTEALTVSLTRAEDLDRLHVPPTHHWRSMVPLRNPLIEDHTHLRTTLLPGLLQVVRVNVSRSVTDAQIFEVGRTFHPSGASVAEHRRLALVMTGRALRGAWNAPPELASVSYFHLKGAVESLFQELRVGGAAFAPAPVPWLHPVRGAAVSLSGQEVGTLGELHPEVAAAYDLPPGVYAADLDLEALLQRATFRPQFAPLPRFPAVRRDLSAIVADGVAAAEVERVIVEAGGSLLATVDVFDVYTGPPGPPGHRNLALALSFRSNERTLSADEVGMALRRITEALARRLRAKIRQ